MATAATKYKKPRKINAVSISLAFVAFVLGWVVYQYLPATLLKQEAYRVLDETASKFAHRKSLYLTSKPDLAKLRGKMNSQLRLVGIKDPAMESWIEIDDKHHVRFGVLYSYFIEWPGDVIKKQEKTVEMEYPLEIR